MDKQLAQNAHTRTVHVAEEEFYIAIECDNVYCSCDLWPHY